ncbi:hypothetical protein NE626_00075 [Intestinimonas massiliensis]|uniref:Uncharacterized protein n=1 Tax=Intestinimonas massiliensis (ex Afouda et al. 2020) TaxID=1673721 RepID=A0ABS9M981_9FIRM|nr:hypothetical protein [Intestinimonas massiliensis (ex Afouda et al. 2020)]MCG4527362.1 hypothetical protein [Intestinimonas massiliensis (ex Afouda et al. 2020)]MCQ4805215.1 hypothetical protein [Intestinimonas massiliensis (ex Afouda et al. 2020)]
MGACFRAEHMDWAKQFWRDCGDERIDMAMLGYSNVCRNQCLHGGMRLRLNWGEK